MRKGILIVLTLSLPALLWQAGCNRHIDSKNPIRSLPDAPPAPLNVRSLMGDRSVTLSWEVTDTAAVARFRIYSETDTAVGFSVVDSSTGFSKALTNLPLDQPVQVRVTSVNSARIESRPSEEITVVSGLLQLTIDNGNEYSRDRNVQVQVSAPTVPLYVELSEDPLLAGALLQDFRSPISFDLSAGDGVKTVYARLTFSDAARAEGILVDSIILDTESRIDSVYFKPSGRSFGTGDTVRFYLAAHGETGGTAQVSFPGVTRVRLADFGAEGDLTAGDGIYSFAWIVPVGVTVTNGIVNGAFTDAAGNAAAATQSAQLLTVQSSTPPSSVTLAVGLVDTATAHLSWTRNEDSDFGSYRIYRSVSPGIGAPEDFLAIAIISSQGSTSYDDYLTSAGTYYYRVFVFDAGGLHDTGSNEVVVIR